MASLTASRTGTLYFAYGSNLSPHQMQHRCTDSAATSAVPVAVARLDGWKWVICERGYANIVPVLRHDPLHEDDGDGPPVHRLLRNDDNDDDAARQGPEAEAGIPTSVTVWGVLYNMTPGDESVLDAYEGHDDGRNPRPERNPDARTRARTPLLQGNWDYNKWYIDVTVTKWLQPPSMLGLDAYPDQNVVKVLTYVDELRTGEGPILKNYIRRMNRAIEEGVELGVPRRWVDKVMRRWVVPGIFPEHGYVGTNKGYVPETDMESSTEVV